MDRLLYSTRIAFKESFFFCHRLRIFQRFSCTAQFLDTVYGFILCLSQDGYGNFESLTQMHLTDIDSKIPKRSRSYACKFPCNAGIRSTNFKVVYEQLYCPLCIWEGVEKRRNKLNSVSRHALSVSRAFESEVLVHSRRTACSVAQR